MREAAEKGNVIGGLSIPTYGGDASGREHRSVIIEMSEETVRCNVRAEMAWHFCIGEAKMVRNRR